MSYAIIGTGAVGTALARQFARAGVDVVIAGRRDPETLRPLTDELGGHVAAVTLDAALEADTLLLAIPFGAVEDFAKSRPDWRGKTIIDATNAFGVAPEVMAGRMSSDLVAAAFKGAAVVKSFNQLPAALLARDPSDDGGRRVMFVAGNDEAATEAVKALVDRLGFSPIGLGRIDEGGRLLQITGPLILHNLNEQPLKRAA